LICVIALIVFGILAVFSASYRPLAKEAWDCVLRRITLRKCESGLNERLRSQIAGRLMTKSPKTAALVFRHFELLSWILVLLTISSLGYGAYGAYNYYQYGNCYGPEDSTSFCPFAAFDGETNSGFESDYAGEMVFPTADDDPAIGPEDAKVTMIEFGCYMCPYTKEAEPIVNELLKEYEGKIRFVFRDFPLPSHEETRLHAVAADCALEQGKFWEMHDKFFEMQDECRAAEDHWLMVDNAAKGIGLDFEKFAECVDSGKYDKEVEKDINDGIKAKIVGTPTFFINNRTITGPKPIKAFEAIIEEELEK